MNDYKFTQNEIQLIEIAVAEQILKAKREIDDNRNVEMNRQIEKKYYKLLNTIEVEKRYAENIDKLS